MLPTRVTVLLLVCTVSVLSCNRREPPPREPERETATPPPPSTPQGPDSFLVALTTSRGALTLVVHRAWAPQGADRFYALVKGGLYDGARFFRVVRGFVVQFGLPADPQVGRTWSSQVLPDDPVRQPNQRGTEHPYHASVHQSGRQPAARRARLRAVWSGDDAVGDRRQPVCPIR